LHRSLRHSLLSPLNSPLASSHEKYGYYCQIVAPALPPHDSRHSATALLAAFSASTGVAQVVSTWTKAGDGLWNVGANWDTDPFVPNNQSGATFEAVLDDTPAVPYTVTLDRDENVDAFTVDAFTMDYADATLLHAGAEFRVLGTANLVSGTYYLAGGAIVGGTFNIGPGATMEFSTTTTTGSLGWR
jgi:hypothetical protein